MPYTEEQRREIVKFNGYDPNVYDYQEGVGIIERDVPQTDETDVTLQPLSQERPPGTLTSMFREAARTLPALAEGRIFAGLAARGLRNPSVAKLAPAGGVASKYILPGIAQLLGTLAGGELNRKIGLVDPEKERLDQETNPKASLLGRVAPGLLFGSPTLDPRPALYALSGKGKELTEFGKEMAANQVMSAGFGAGAAGAGPLYDVLSGVPKEERRPFMTPMTLAEIALNAMTSKPWRGVGGIRTPLKRDVPGYSEPVPPKEPAGLLPSHPIQMQENYPAIRVLPEEKFAQAYDAYKENPTKVSKPNPSDYVPDDYSRKGEALTWIQQYIAFKNNPKKNPDPGKPGVIEVKAEEVPPEPPSWTQRFRQSNEQLLGELGIKGPIGSKKVYTGESPSAVLSKKSFKEAQEPEPAYKQGESTPLGKGIKTTAAPETPAELLPFARPNKLLSLEETIAKPSKLFEEPMVEPQGPEDIVSVFEPRPSKPTKRPLSKSGPETPPDELLTKLQPQRTILDVNQPISKVEYPAGNLPEKVYSPVSTERPMTYEDTLAARQEQKRPAQEPPALLSKLPRPIEITSKQPSKPIVKGIDLYTPVEKRGKVTDYTKQSLTPESPVPTEQLPKESDVLWSQKQRANLRSQKIEAEQGSLKSSFEAALDRLKTGGTTHAGLSAVWDSLIDAVKVGYRTTGTLKGALEEGIKSVRNAAPNLKFTDEDVYREFSREPEINSALKATPVEQPTSGGELYTGLGAIKKGLDDAFNLIKEYRSKGKVPAGPRTLAGEKPEEITTGFGRMKGYPQSTKEEAGFVERVFRPGVEAIRAVDPTSGPIVADAMHEVWNKTRARVAKMTNEIFTKANKLSDKYVNDIYKVMIAERRAQKSFRDTLQPEQQAVYDDIRSMLKREHDEQRADGQLVKEGNEYRPAKDDPFYIFNVASTKVIDTLLNNPTSELAKNLRDDFINFNKSKAPKNVDATKWAEDQFNEYLAPFRTETTSTEFGPVRRSEGVGLPDSWIEPDFKKALLRYSTRFAKDREYFRGIEKDPTVMRALGKTKDSYGNPIQGGQDVPSIGMSDAVKNVMTQFKGVQTRTQATVDAASRLFNASILGIKTGVTDVLSTGTAILRYDSPKNWAKDVYNSIANIKEGIKNAYETGLNKHDISSLEEVYAVNSRLADDLNDLANRVSTFSGRKFTETVARGLAQAGTESVIGHLKIRASKNDKFALDTLNKLSKNWSQLEAKELATRLSQRIQGTYSFNDLPIWATNSWLAPFAKLQRWNISQVHYFIEDVVKPAQDGNFAPLLSSIFATLFGASVIQPIRDMIEGKESQIPAFKEILEAKGDQEKTLAIAYKLSGGAAFAGVGGLLSDLIKMPLDVKYQGRVRGYNYPTVEVATSSAETLLKALNALIDGEDLATVSMQAVNDVLVKNNQTLDVMVRQLEKGFGAQWPEEEQKKRDYRMYKKLQGRGGAVPLSYNPYDNLSMNKYEEATDLEQAGKYKAKAFERVMSKARTPEEGIRRFNTLNIDYMPSTESPDFPEYYQFLIRTKGRDYAEKRYEDYFKQRALNEQKKALPLSK